MGQSKHKTAKERTYLNAILGSATGYVEVNLSQNIVTEYSSFFISMWEIIEKTLLPDGTPTYTDFNEWFASKLVSSKDRDHFRRISSADYLLDIFSKGEKRASVLFDSKTTKGSSQPCRYIFFLYKDNATDNVHSLCVLYDLTEDQRKALELERLENELRLSRISNFTSQMQPHFLYNSLGAIQEIMLEDPAYASELLGDFTVHLRSCIRSMSGDALLPFDLELENIKAYVNIEKMRFGEKLRVLYEIESKDFYILPLSIQPLVENSIRHGIYHKGSEGGTVVIKSFEDKDSWIIQVEDDGIGFDIKEYNARIKRGSSLHTGLRNLIFRIETVMNGKVNVKSRKGEGAIVTVILPKKRV